MLFFSYLIIIWFVDVLQTVMRWWWQLLCLWVVGGGISIGWGLLGCAIGLCRRMYHISSDRFCRIILVSIDATFLLLYAGISMLLLYFL
jgi:hypothetical protein